VPDTARPSEELWAIHLHLQQWVNLGPLTTVFTGPHDSAPLQGIIFPQDLPAPRMGHAMCTDRVGALWVAGGATGALVDTLLADVWMFDIARRKWRLVSSEGGAAVLDGATACGDGRMLMMFGSSAADRYTQTMHAISMAA
jgi:hypothetical protein